MALHGDKKEAFRWRRKLFRVVHLHDFFISTVDWDEWRAHMAWANSNGAGLKNAVSARFGTTMVLMSLLLASQVTVLFSGSNVGDDIRSAMMDASYDSIALYIGVLLILGMFLALYTIITTYMAWGTLLPINDANVLAVFRSRMGLHVMSLPNRLATATIYVYLTWLTMVLWKLLPLHYGAIFTALALAAFFYFNFVNSGLQRTIMLSSAMKDEPILSNQALGEMWPEEFDEALIEKAISVHVNIPATPKRRFSTALDSVRLHYCSSGTSNDDDKIENHL
jgi:hypothetical protein